MADHTAPSGVSTWDDPAGRRRPGITDVGSAAMVNQAGAEPPRNGEFPEADWLNQVQRQANAAGRMIALAKMTVVNPAGTPSIFALSSPVTVLVPSDFTVTGGGTGITDISWAAGTLPPVGCDPEVSVGANGNHSATVELLTATSLRVHTRTAGALANLRFTLSIN